MIYKDSQSVGDREDMPAERAGEGCENCGEDYWSHCGWKCSNSDQRSQCFSKLYDDHRYLTASMQASILPAAHLSVADIITAAYGDSPTKAEVKPAEPKQVDLADWRTWAHNEPGDCPCGIKRVQCEFH